MKKILTSLALVGAVVTGANAQKSADLVITMIDPAAAFTISCGTNDSTAVRVLIVNNGPDALNEQDSVAIRLPDNELGYVYVVDLRDADGNPITLDVGDTLIDYAFNINSSEIGTLVDLDATELIAPPYTANTDYGFYAEVSAWNTSWADPTTDNNGDAVVVTWCDNGTGLNDLNALSGKMNVYPNPSTGVVNVKMNFDIAAEASIQISDVTGRVLMTKNFGKLIGAQNLSIDASSLSNGMYNVILTAGDKRGVSKLTIAK